MRTTLAVPPIKTRWGAYAIILGVFVVSACTKSSPHGPGDPKEIVGTWRAQQGETIRVFENNTYSINCNGDVNNGVVTSRSKNGARLKNFECLSQGRMCAQSWGSELSACATDDDPSADLEIRVNYLKLPCSHAYCFEWGDYESGAASNFAKISDDPEAK